MLIKDLHTLCPFFERHCRWELPLLCWVTSTGGANHNLILPLYNPETLLTTDPEKGFQTIIRTHHWKMDAWIDWQSFIYEMDKHQEAFTVGMSQVLHLCTTCSWVVA